jgi:putative transposase
MKRSYKFRLKPTKGQVIKLENNLITCRQLYNFFLVERKEEYELMGKSQNRFDQIKSIAGFSSCCYSQVLQNVADRIDKSYKNFFRRVKSGEKPGFPRFKSVNRYTSFTYPQSGFKLCADQKHIRLSKIGDIRIKLHREVQGQLKTCNVIKSWTGKWYVCLSVEQADINIKQPIYDKIGIDVGIFNLATPDHGLPIENKKYLKASETKLKKLQSSYSRKKTKSKKYQLANLHEKIKNQRSDYLHKTARFLVDNYQLISVEDIFPSQMLGKISNINKAILDASWKKLISFIEYKAEEAGVQMIKVNPAYTSQTCYCCGHRQKMPLNIRIYQCKSCGYTEDRDVNAAKNILGSGSTTLGFVPEASTIALA